jgi:hypothetical protein
MFFASRVNILLPKFACDWNAGSLRWCVPDSVLRIDDLSDSFRRRGKQTSNDIEYRDHRRCRFGLAWYRSRNLARYTTGRIRQLEHVKESQQDRKLAPDQQAQIIDLLRDAPKGKVLIPVYGTDLEALNFAQELGQTLKAAGYDATVLPASMFGGLVPIQGLTLRVKSDPLPAHSLAVYTALNKVGIRCSFEKGAQFPEDVVQLFVAPKPRK